MSALLRAAPTDSYGAVDQEEPPPHTNDHVSRQAKDDHADDITHASPPPPLHAIGSGRRGASMFSKLFFSYANKLMHVGNTRQLDLDDMWTLEGNNVSTTAFDTFNRQFVKHSGSVVRAMIATYGLPLTVCGLAALFSAACSLAAPGVLHHVIDAFAAPSINVDDLIFWLGLFFVSLLLNAIVTAHMNLYLQLLSLRLTVALKSLLFRKAVHRSMQSKHDLNAVDISNLYTTDVNNILMAALQVNSLWLLPLQIGVVVSMLYNVLGFAAFVGLGVIGASMSMSFRIALCTSQAFKDVMKRKDARMHVVKEVFGAIQIVKLNAWERQFASRIDKLRVLELQAVARFVYWMSTTIVVFWASPMFVSVTSFAVYALVMEQQLTAAKVFTAIALFNTIRYPLRDLPGVIQKLIQAKISLDRMTAFLALDEFNPRNITREDATRPTDVAVAVENGSFAWNSDASALLTNVNLCAKRGDLLIVHGAVGAGKSALCAALLGELHRRSGSVFVRGRVAYYSQQPWIQHMSIRDNILFGSAFDARRYAKVLDACGLLPDLACLLGGDAAEIGDKGVNLSGGQKARVSLARACYSDADVFILDAPLAAVDAVVQSEIFSKCVCTLLEHKTVVLVTHNPDIIASEAANVVVHVQDGSVVVERRGALQPRSVFSSPVIPPSQEKYTQTIKCAKSHTTTATSGQLIHAEKRHRGRVASTVTTQYIASAGGIKVAVFLALVLIVWQSLQISSDLWLSHWTGQKLGTYNEVETEHNMAVYTLLSCAAAFTVGIRTFTVAVVGLRASQHLFDAMTASLLSAPMRFFDANPIGRIVNRYSDDVSVVDFSLSIACGSFISKLFFTICQLATAVYVVNFLGIFIVPLIYLYVQVATFYLAPSREIARLMKVAASPVLSHVSESEDGMSVIRAFGPAYVERTFAENLKRLDVSNRVWFVANTVRQWFQLRMQLLGCGVVVVIVSALVYLRDYVTPGTVGLAFTYALNVDGRLSVLVQAWSNVEMMMVSPERIIEYAEMPAEGSEQLLVIEPPAAWPQHGTIAFEDVVFSYKPGASAVLKRVSFAIHANEKIGIVGRTGAGKSSLTMALFRINELDAGRIVIDGVDIASMPLQTLRSRLSIIPQAPVLFKGTLRAYMDPFDDFSDVQIWDALDKVEMKSLVAALEQQLAHELSENGKNFSVGERQMLCMARALLTQTRIVVMDEATASIDHATELKLQAVIARDFANATVLTIAHRLATVLDSDRIMVLHDGQVVEFDAPRKLVQNPLGVFYTLANEGGYLDRLQ